MSTELGAFAVLSSLLLYLTDVIACHSEVQSKKATWLKNIENKVILRQEHPNPHSGIRPTKFQLLQSRFMNNNREPYRNKLRDVGKLIIKEKQLTNRNVLNSIVSKLDRSSSTEEEGPKIKFQEKARWVSTCGKNTVKNVLKKFLAAEEKEAKEKQATPKKKASNNDLPKVHKKNSVLSKLKEKFEQTSNVCSAVDVKALLPCKDEKKNKRNLEKKATCKAEIRVLEINLRTLTRFSSPQPQHLVCTTVPIPKFCVATEISHSWTLSTNIKHTPQLSEHSPKVEGAKDTQRTHDFKPDKISVPDNKAHGRQQKVQSQNKCHDIPQVEMDKNDSIETDTTSANLSSNQDSVSSSQKTVPLTDHIPNLPKKSLAHKENVVLPADNQLSCSEDKNTTQIVRKENRSITCSSSTPAKGISSHIHQEVKGDDISDVSEGMYRPEETEIELTEPTKEPPFAGQKCFPEEKALENIPPLQSPATQAFHNTEEPPVNNQQSSVKLAAGGKTPQLKPSQGNKQDLRTNFFNAAQNKEKMPDKEETGTTPTENDHTNQVKQEEAKPARSQNNELDLQIENEHLFLKPQTQQNKQNNKSPAKEAMNQAFQFPTCNNSQAKEKLNVIKNYVCNDSENHHFPLFGDTEGASCETAVDDIGQAYLVNAVTDPQCNSGNANISVSQLEASRGLLNEFFSHETHTVEEHSGPLSEKCHVSTMDHSAKPESNIAEVNRPWCGIGNVQIPSSNELSNNESYIQGKKEASQNSEKHHVPSLNELQKPQAAPGLDDKAICNFHSDIIKSKNSAARDKDILPKILEKKSQPPSTKDVKKREDSPAGKTALMQNGEKQETPLGNNTEKQGEAQVMAEGKSEKSNLPSQNETTGLGNSAGKKGNLPETAQCLIPSSVNRREQEDKRVGEQSPVTRGEKTISNSRMPPKSVKSDLTKGGIDTTKANISKKQQMTPPDNNNKREKTDLTKDGRDTTERNLSHTHQLTPTKKNNKQAKNRSIKEGGDTAAANSSQTQPLTPPKDKTSRRGVSPPLTNSRYQIPPRDLAKYDGVKVRDENITKDQLSPFKRPMKYDGAHFEERNAQDKIREDKMPSLGEKVKPESKTENAKEKSSNSKQKLLPLKTKHSKNEETSVSEGNSLGNFQKDKMDHPVTEQPKPSFNYPGKPDVIAKDKKQAAWNSKKDQLLLSELKPKSHQNKVTAGKQQQQRQVVKDCVNPKSSVRDEEYTHHISEEYNLSSLDEPEGYKKGASQKKAPSKNIDQQRAPQLSQNRTFQKKKTLTEAGMDPQLGSSRKTCPSEHRKAQQSSGKYQILSAHDLSGRKSEEAKKYRTGAVQEGKARLVGLEKYKAESYSEGPTNLSFKPMVIRVTDTIKLDN